jgi:hypothetical protein
MAHVRGRARTTRAGSHAQQPCVSIVWGRGSAGTGMRPGSRPAVMGWCAQIVHSDSYYVYAHSLGTRGRRASRARTEFMFTIPQAILGRTRLSETSFAYPHNPQFGEGALSCASHMPPPPKTPARRQRAPASTRAAGGPARPIACSSGLCLVQGDFCYLLREQSQWFWAPAQAKSSGDAMAGRAPQACCRALLLVRLATARRESLRVCS